MGNGSSANRKYTYEQYYEAMKQQHGGSMRNVPLNFDTSIVDPYILLGVTPQSSFEELKRNYRRIALKVHPDRGGSDELFQLVSDCFRKVGHDIQMRMADRQHHELKAAAQSYYADRPVNSKPVVEHTVFKTNYNGGGDFASRFNQAFDDHKLRDDDDDANRGYADMMVASNPKREDISVPVSLKSYNPDKFNQVFEQKVPVRKDMVVYKEPEPLIMAKKLAFTELGGKTDDFSSTGEGGEKRSLQYTDYMKAHTTSRLIDPSVVKPRGEYKSVEQYEAAREKIIAKPLSSKEQQRIDMKKQEEERMEQERLARLRARDDAIARHYDTVNRLMIAPR